METKAIANNAIAIIWEKLVMYKGIIMLFRSFSWVPPCSSGNNDIKVPRKNMMGAVTSIQNLALPIRLMLAYRIEIVPPQNNKNVVAVKIPGSVTIKISSNTDSIPGKVPADFSVVTTGW